MSEQKVSAGGIVLLVLGAFAIAGAVLLSAMNSGSGGGNAGALSGVLGAFAWLVGILGGVLALVGLSLMARRGTVDQ